VRNAVDLYYPVVESIRSILPICDEVIVAAGDSTDGTTALIRGIDDPKVKIIETVWDRSQFVHGATNAQQTNIALDACTGDWAFYVQADEVVHEEDLPIFVAAMRRHLDDRRVEGLLCDYLHFYGDYWSLNPWFYHRAVRIIRNDGQVESFGDAVGFCLKADQAYLQAAHKDRLRASGATMYHYGWVKEPKVLLDKFRYQIARHQGDEPGAEQAAMLAKEAYEFEEYDIMKNFTGTHPAVMRDRVARYPKLRPGRNRWLEPAFYRAMMKRGFRG